MSIGHFGPITVEQARRAAKTKLGCVAAGQDPAEDLQIKRRDMTISDLIDLYEKQGCFVRHGRRQGEPMKPKTKTETVARLRNHVMPLLGQRKSRSLNPGDIEGLVADVASGKTAREARNRNGRRIVLRGGVGMAGKVARDLSVVFSFAIRHEIVTTNPVTHAIFRKIDNRRMRFLTVEELASLGAALDVSAARLSGEGAISIMVREILPNVMHVILIEGIVRLGYAFFTVATLSFLGLGIQPPSTDWGLAIAENYGFLTSGMWWIVTFNAAAIVSLVVATNLIAEGLGAFDG